jgi:ankyrin repeat protein
LLEFEAPIDALNVLQQTPFHIAAVNKCIEFGQFLISKKARTSCVDGCTKCRWLVTMIKKREKTERS